VRVSVTKQSHSAIKHMVLCCRGVGLLFLAIVGCGLLQTEVLTQTMPTKSVGTGQDGFHSAFLARSNSFFNKLPRSNDFEVSPRWQSPGLTREPKPPRHEPRRFSLQPCLTD
jgi:hypothetical protein